MVQNSFFFLLKHEEDTTSSGDTHKKDFVKELYACQKEENADGCGAS